jgi:hypothetical protein
MTIQNTLRLVAVALLGACTSEGPQSPIDTSDPSTLQEPPTSSGNQDNTFDHDQALTVDPFEILNRLQTQGPPEFQAMMHACGKIPIATLGNMLKSRGVNLANTATTSAGKIFTSGAQALGAANYAARQPEAIALTTATAAKIFDIWVAAAPEIVAAMPNLAVCKVGGTATMFFDAQGKCTLAGITCLTGVMATQTHVDLCNQIVAGASTPALGQSIAVGSIASAAVTCE